MIWRLIVWIVTRDPVFDWLRKGAFRPSFHHAADGRGPRKVYVDGALIEGAIYADTELGFVRAYSRPFRLSADRKNATTYDIRGKVEVKFEE